MVSLEQLLVMVANSTVGVYPEVKSPRVVNMVLQGRGANTTVEEVVVNLLHRCPACPPTPGMAMEEQEVIQIAFYSPLTWRAS